ncbi:MAG: STAS-like domain-containing protein [bacterium]
MKTIPLRPLTGPFAENKDIARMIRLEMITPALSEDGEVILDFSGIEGATQSFVHALISELFRQHGSQILDRIRFRDCNSTLQEVITIVTEYMQEAE